MVKPRDPKVQDYEGRREYPKALRPPNFSTKPYMIQQSDGSNTEHQEKGRHAQVVVQNEEEEDAVLKEWSVGVESKDSTSTPASAPVKK